MEEKRTEEEVEYEKVEPKRDPVWDYKKEQELEGIYESFEENVGPNDSMLYHIKKLDGSRVVVWGSTVLDTRMSEIDIGSRIKIQYLGDVPTPGGGNPYHNFEVWKVKKKQLEDPEPPLPEE